MEREREGGREGGREKPHIPPHLPGERGPLPLQILSESLLNLAQQVSETLQTLLDTRYVQHIHNQWGLGHLLHHGQEL